MERKKPSRLVSAARCAFLFVGWFLVELGLNHEGWVAAAVGALVYTVIVGGGLTIYERKRESRLPPVDRGPVTISSRTTADRPGREN